MSAYLIIFGAAVRADGSPSGSLLRRVEGALRYARTITSSRFIATGGVGRFGPAEAEVIRALLLRAGIRDEDVLVDDLSRDTLESIERCHAILRKQSDVETVVPCTSAYHVPRCSILLRLLGYRTLVIAMPADRPHLPFRKWIWFVSKELLALPYDVLLLLVRERVLRNLP